MSEAWKIGPWTFERASGELVDGEGRRRLEPKVADLLALLVTHAGSLLAKEVIQARLWSDVVVGDDALPRCVSKLRKALGDDPKAPRFVETVPKRGYRLLVEPIALPAPKSEAGDSSSGSDSGSNSDSRGGGAGGQLGDEPGAGDTVPRTRGKGPVPRMAGAPRASADEGPEHRRRVWPIVAGVVLGVAMAVGAWLMLGQGPGATDSPALSHARAMAEKADDFYHRINRTDNESAIELYERALGVNPDFAPAHSGLANALVQRVLRYPATEGLIPIEPVNLGNALATGRLRTAEASRHLDRALGLAERAVRLAPRSAPSHKALGFVYSALDRPEEAMAAYDRALALDPEAWDVLINKGDLLQIAGQPEEALAVFERGYAVMGRVYERQSSKVGPWHGEMGVLIGDLHEAAGRADEAEGWYRRVLASAPFHPSATCTLARLLRRSGDASAAGRLLAERQERTAEELDCAELLRAIGAEGPFEASMPGQPNRVENPG